MILSLNIPANMIEDAIMGPPKEWNMENDHAIIR